MRQVQCGWLVVIVSFMMFGAWSNALAAAPDSNRLQAELAAGEFAPALAAVRELTDPAQRNTAIGQVILAQQLAGAGGAAAQTTFMGGGGVGPGRMAFPFGGGAQPDFDTLMELIRSTIAPTTWSDVGGQGAIKSFPGGVIADATGLLQRVKSSGVETELANARFEALRSGANRDVRQSSTLRKVSLPRLEKAIQGRLQQGLPLDDDLSTLAGLQRVRFVFVYPETGDIVLAGPAGDWRLDAERRIVAVENGRPVVRLEDLVTLLRAGAAGQLKFGCSITPTQAGLARTQQFADASSKKPLRPGERDAWLGKLREQMGRQTIEVFGVDPTSRVAQVIVEADYRMKLVGLGLEEGTLGVTSYLDSIEVAPGAAAPPLDVLRWWFTMNYGALATDNERRVFEIRGSGVKVLSENELLAAGGQRVHTGASADRNRDFAANFTQHFPALAAKYPIYAELQNVFDLALVVALLKSEELPESVDWRPDVFTDAARLSLPQGPASREVETVMNHRIVNKTQIIAAVSGGVSVDPAPLVLTKAIQVERSPRWMRDYQYGQPRRENELRWWWD